MTTIILLPTYVQIGSILVIRLGWCLPRKQAIQICYSSQHDGRSSSISLVPALQQVSPPAALWLALDTSFTICSATSKQWAHCQHPKGTTWLPYPQRLKGIGLSEPSGRRFLISHGCIQTKKLPTCWIPKRSHVPSQAILFPCCKSVSFLPSKLTVAPSSHGAAACFLSWHKKRKHLLVPCWISTASSLSLSAQKSFRRRQFLPEFLYGSVLGCPGNA